MTTSQETIKQLVANQHRFFRSHVTLDVEYRLAALRKLRSAIIAHQQPLADALYLDLHKSYEEAYLTEITDAFDPAYLMCGLDRDDFYSPKNAEKLRRVRDITEKYFCLYKNC